MPTLTTEIQVTKRSGEVQDISFDKILVRIKKLGAEANITQVNYTLVAMKVIEQLFDKISTSRIDELMAGQCTSMSTTHTDYGILASRIIISNHQKNTSNSFSEIIKELYNVYNNNGVHSPLINDSVLEFVESHKDVIDETIDYERDYLIDYFGFKTLEKSYLFRINGVIKERPQHMWMRVAIAIHGETPCSPIELENVLETYYLMSTKHFTHATPTLFNAGTNRQQLSSCFLAAMKDDSLEGIFDTLKDCAIISKHAGGIGLHTHNIRATGSHIYGTNGKSNGLVPMLRVFNNTARYVDQGGGKRPGSIAIYLEPWHADIVNFLDLRKNHGDEEQKARDLFYALWISDEFMSRVKNEGTWSLMCPSKCPGLSDVYGDEFKTLYESYEAQGLATSTIPARELWLKILDAQMETGTPYMLYKDAANNKSNQKNIGTIKSSNLCCEIMEYSDKDETAVCNLASIGLPTFVDCNTKTFDYEKLHKVTKVVTKNLNKLIDINFYPTEQTRTSNLRHRPIGIGVQGLADVFFKMDIAFHSNKAKEINKLIFETIYHASLEQSCELAIERRGLYETGYAAHLNDYEYTKLIETPETTNLCGAYSSFIGSPASKGILQFDMWNVEPSNRYNWGALKHMISCSGIRNSLLVAPMPTASTAQIMGYNECFEPITGNIYSRRTNAGEFVVVNKYMMNELCELGIWSPSLKNNIIQHNGSVQHLTELSKHIKDKYKTVWEIPMSHVIDMSADRGAFVCQSQSMNLWMAEPSYAKLTSMHFYTWSKGLKTGIYYLRRRARHQAQQFTIDPSSTTNSNNTNETELNKEDEPCEMCSA
jgi:ribonucleotide reductase alpha subunit